MLDRLAAGQNVSDETYVELVRSLFTTFVPTAIMGIVFAVVAAVAVRDAPEPMLTSLAVLGVVASLVRVAALLDCRRRFERGELAAGQARQAEHWYGCAYLAFAAVLGLFASRCFEVAGVGVQMIVAPLIVGYAAGVAAGMSLRPWICVPAVLLAVLPVIAASLVNGNTFSLVLAFVLAAYLLGGIGSMLARYRSETEKIALRQLLGSLARKDHLTGLANRLALADAFVAAVKVHGRDAIAIHCLDLDRFKHVNDRHGHPAGDLLLRLAGERLRSVSRRSDTVARLGGDEFVLLQVGIANPNEAEMLARRIVRSLAEPYQIAGERLTVGVSVGYAIASSTGEDLAQLLNRADAALYHAKRSGGGTVADADGARRVPDLRLAV